MKKRFLFALILPLGLLTSCSNDSKSHITFGKLFDSSLGMTSSSLYLHTDNLSYFDLNRKVSNKENFVLAVYEYKTLEEGKDIDCACYFSFAASLMKYMEEKNAQVFAIDPSDLKGVSNMFSLDISLGEQTLAIFKDGNVISQEKDGDDNLSTYEKVASYLDNNVTWSDMLYINVNQLNTMSIKGQEFTVGYLRKSCSECSYFSYNFLKEYNTKAFNKKIYVIECDDKGIRYDENGEYDGDTWQSFKDYYGLSSLYNKNFGYDIGYVPSFFTYKGDGSSLYPASDIIDGAVYFNDTLGVSNDICKITSSYWDNRSHPFFSSLDSSVRTNLVGMEVAYENIEISLLLSINWKKSDARKYHDVLMKGFLDYYSK